MGWKLCSQGDEFMSVIITARGSGNTIEIDNGSGCFARKTSIPSGWNKIAYGVLCQWTGPATGIGSGAGWFFGLGLCSGQSKILGDSETDHFVGATSPIDKSWLSNRYFSNPFTVYASKKVGSTKTDYGTLGSTMSGSNGSDAEKYGMTIVTLEKTGATTIKVGGIGCSSANANVSEVTFIGTMTSLIAPTYHADFTEQTVTVDYNDGSLDHVALAYVCTPSISLHIKRHAVVLFS